MSRRQTVLLAFLAVAFAATLVLILRNPEPPFLPADDAHAGFLDADGCLVCHGVGAEQAQKPTHPVGRDCMRCHAFSR